jgi:hypothetical protein
MTFSEHHLRRLDRQNRLLLILVAVALALIAARELAFPAQSSPSILEASSFLLRGRLSIQNNEPSFALLDEKGRVRAGLSLNGDGVPSLALFDEDANSVAGNGVGVRVSPGAPNISIAWRSANGDL